MTSAKSWFLARVLGFGVLLLFYGATVDAADMDPSSFIGTWSINAAKSKATGDALPPSYTSTFTDAGEGKIHTHVEWTEADGSKHMRDYTAAANGKPAPVKGDPSVDHVRITSQKAGQIHVKFSKAGKVTEWSHYSISPDGSSVKGTESARDEKGATVTYHVVFDRK